MRFFTSALIVFILFIPTILHGATNVCNPTASAAANLLADRHWAAIPMESKPSPEALDKAFEAAVKDVDPKFKYSSRLAVRFRHHAKEAEELGLKVNKEDDVLYAVELDAATERQILDMAKMALAEAQAAFPNERLTLMKSMTVGKGFAVNARTPDGLTGSLVHYDVNGYLHVFHSAKGDGTIIFPAEGNFAREVATKYPMSKYNLVVIAKNADGTLDVARVDLQTREEVMVKVPAGEWQEVKGEPAMITASERARAMGVPATLHASPPNSDNDRLIVSFSIGPKK